MKTTSSLLLAAAILGCWTGISLNANAAGFTPLLPAPVPRIVSNSVAYPGGHYEAGNLLDGKSDTEYSSEGKGTNTFVEFEFPQPAKIGAFRHLDRNDPAIVSSSELTFFDAQGVALSTVSVKHVNTRGGETFFSLPAPVLAKRVRWHITGLGPQHFGTVGGAEVQFFIAGDPEPTPRHVTVEAKALPFVKKEGGQLTQTMRLTFDHPYAEPAEATVHVEGVEPKPIQLKPGKQSLEFSLPAVDKETKLHVSIDFGGQPLLQTTVPRQPMRKLTVYIQPHSHTDIGYTEIQTAIEKKQVQNLIDGMAAAKRTASYPEGARFVWNVEVGWAADLYLRRLSEPQRADFLDAVKKGQVALNGMYLNELTGLCRPEELIHLFRFATKLGDQTGVPIESAMISDVPGYTWGVVPAMNQAGIKYFSTAPNYFDRIGSILRDWENKPFWWIGPDGKSKVLVWIPFWGYAMSHRYGKMSPQLVEDFYAGLEKRGYPYDIAYARWSGHGDNAVPDPAICEFVKDWNEQYAWPKFIISGTSEAFRALEKQYGDKLPIARGDWSPYWEDGAGSSALETGMNRASSDRVAQAETLFAMLNPKAYPAAKFEDAWRNVLLYSEHTWGAWCSVTDPEKKETKEQWEIKKSYADEADKQSRELLREALGSAPANVAPAAGFVDILNTLSGPRTELVTLSKELSAVGDLVFDDAGKPVPSQRLANGELAFFAKDVPPFAARRYQISARVPNVQGGTGLLVLTPTNTGEGERILGDFTPFIGFLRITNAGGGESILAFDNGLLHVSLDEKTGGIAELTVKGIKGNLADTSGGEALNDYLYLPGDDLKKVQRNGSVKITVKEPGPLVASLLIESDAPGCKKLTREIRLVAGQDYVEIINTVDKARLPSKSYMAKEGKESVNFAFPFNVPDGELLCDVPLGAFRPEADQMPSACKNWLTVGRWVDVANRDFGVTWVTLDAPLVQIGGLTANLLNSQTNPDVWRKKIERSQRLYSWAMNNHWGTNYRAYQEGPTIFRFILRPHRRSTPADATRFATAFSQPLLPVSARAFAPPATPLLRLDSPDVLVTALKPSDDGKALIVRLFGASGQDAQAKLNWAPLAPTQLWLSDTSEKPLQKTTGPVSVPAWGVVTLRAELGN